MPLGHFSIVIVNSCQQTVSKIQAENATAARKSLQQYTEYSDDSSLTTLTSTPVLSDMEIPAPKTPPQGSELSDNLRYDGSTSTPRKSKKLQALQTTRMKNQATALKLALSAASPSQNTKTLPELSNKADASITQRLATGHSPCQMKQDEVALAPAQEGSVLEGEGDPKVPAHVAENEQRSTAERLKRPRRMAIAEEEFEQLRLRPLAQGSESSNTMKPVLSNLDQGLKSEQNFEKLQHLKDPTQESGDGPPAPVPYYKAERVFKWKILERPGYEHAPKASRAAATGSQERKARGRQDCQRQPVTGADQSQTARQSPAIQHTSTFQGPPAQHQEAVLIPDDSDGDVEKEEVGQSAAQPETHLDPSTVARLRDSGLLGRPRRR